MTFWGIKDLKGWLLKFNLTSLENIVFYLGISLIVNLISFGYNLYLSHRLIVAEFGAVVVINNLIALLEIPLTTYTKAITHSTATLFGKTRSIPASLWRYYRRGSYGISILLAVIWLIAIPFMMSVFKYTQIFPFVVMMPLWVLSVTAAVDVGFLLGIHLFKQVSLVMLIETILLLVITVILVEAEQPNYLYVAIPLSSLVAFGFNWYLAQSQPQKPIKSTKSIQPTFPWKFYFHSLVSKFAAVTFITVDVLLAKYFLPPEEAGLYTIISVVGKMLYYATSLLGQFVVPLVSKEAGQGKNPAATFKVLFGSTAILLSGMYVALTLLGKWTIPLLMGEHALQVIEYLPYYLLGMVCFGLSSMIIAYHQSNQVNRATVISGLSSVLVIGGILLFHSSIGDISRVMGSVGILSLVLSLIYQTIRRYQRMHPPQQILGYQLVSTQSTPKTTNWFTGLYRKNNKKVYAKIYMGNPISTKSGRLKNEINALKLLNQATSRQITQKVRPPKVIHASSSLNQQILLQEWIEPTAKLELMSDERIFANAKIVLDYFHHISKRLTANQRKTLTARSNLSLSLIYPLLVLKAGWAQPALFFSLVKSLIMFYKSLPSLIKTPAKWLAHRDLHAWNIVLKQEIVYVIDFEYAAFTLPYFDLITCSHLYWNRPKLRRMFLEELEQKLSTQADTQVARAVGLYSIVSLLGSPHLPKYLFTKYQRALKHWLESERLYV